MVDLENKRRYDTSYREAHRGERREYGRRHYHENQNYYKLKARRSQLAKYGITPEQYDAMLAAQGGHCAICPATKPGGRGKFFHVDHNHETGEVRGLLCFMCNRLLGDAKDLPERLRAAAVYLERPVTMPMYYVECTVCRAPDKRILEPEQVASTKCRKCGGKVKRTPKPPTSMLKERVDNGLMPKTLENYVDGQSLTRERSKLDLSRPDWQKEQS